MDHADARELLDLAAVEPGGLDRLAAGDTPEAVTLAGHLAGCPACTDEFGRLRRFSATVRDAVRTTPPDDLRDRTLAFVAAVGRDRTPVPEVGAPEPLSAPTGRRRLGLAPVVAGLAAVLVLAVAGTGLFVSSRLDQAISERDAAIAAQQEVVAALARVTSWSVRVGAEPDVQHVRLDSPGGDPATATVVFSPATGDVVVVADDLVEPPTGRELRCWVEIDGERKPVGKMFFGGGLAYWVGTVEAVREAGDGTLFGISLVEPGGSSGGSDPVLVGRL